MTISLHPMSLGEILDRTFQIYRSRFVTFVVIALLPTVGVMTFWLARFLLEGLVSQTTLPHAVKERISVLCGLVSVDSAESFLSLLVFPVFACCASELFIGGRPGLVEACKASFVRLRSLLFLTALTWAVWFGIGQLLQQIPRIEKLELVATMGLYDHSNITVGLTFLCLKWFGNVVLGAAVCLSLPAWLLEQSTAGNALRRGWMLARRRFGAIFIVWLLRSALVWMFSASFSLLIYLAFKAISAAPQVFYSHAIFRAAAIYLPGRLSVILVRPVFAIAITLIYYDQRIRLEGYDIEWMMNAAGMNTPQTEPQLVAVETASLEEPQG